MKKPSHWLAAVSLSLALLTTSAHAIVGFLTGTPLLTILGFAMATGPLYYNDVHSKPNTAATVATVVAGAILMDGQGRRQVHFVPITIKQAHDLGISDLEAQDFNAETDELNQIAEAVTADLDQIQNPTAEDASALWKHYSGAVSSDTFSAAGKIVRKMLTE
jgi:hypothetical protein